ncbi:MAG: hypothetical protein JW919_06155, partial [Candidatus Omnitrophica bacterium]|nr:hypothetical protein [Candidatus Omnitrophota bacterium]
IALLLMSVSPMDLAIARRTWQDSMVGFAGLLLIYFACEAARAGRKAVWYALFIITGAYCVLIKESGLVIYGLCALWLLWVLIVKEKNYAKGALLAAASALSVAVSIAILAHAVGGFQELITIFRHWKSAIPTNEYAIQYQSGPWYRFLAGFWIVSPVSALLCVIGIAGTLLRPGAYQKIATLPPCKDRASVLGIIFFTAAFMAVAVATPHFQNLRYVSVVFAPFYLLGGLGLWHILSFSKKAFSGGPFAILVACIGIAVIFVSISDYNNFKKIFLRTGSKDLSIGLLEECSR